MGNTVSDYGALFTSLNFQADSRSIWVPLENPGTVFEGSPAGSLCVVYGGDRRGLVPFTVVTGEA